MLKSSYLEGAVSNNEAALVASGLILVDDIKAVVQPDEEKFGGPLPEYIMNALGDARSEYEESQDPQVIDIVIDKHLQSFLYKTAADYPNSFLSGYQRV